MLEYVLLAVSVALGVCRNILSKIVRKVFSGVRGLLVINMITALVAMIIFGAGGVNFEYLKDIGFVAMAVAYGACTMLSQMMYIIAVKDGAVSTCSLIYYCGFIIPMLYAAVFFGEPFSAVQVIGTILLVLSVFAVTGKIERGGNGKWIVPAFSAMFFSGAVGILQKLFNAVYRGEGTNTYLFFSFAAMLVLSAIAEMVLRMKSAPAQDGKKNDTGNASAAIIAMAVAFAVSVAAANKLNLYLSGIISGIVFFPIVNGGCISATAFTARLILKERLNILQWLGIIGSIFL